MVLSVTVALREGVADSVAQAVPVRETGGEGERLALAVPLRAAVPEFELVGEPL